MFNITGLKYAYTIYDVRVYLKSYVAKAGPEDWSEPATLTFVTLPKRKWFCLKDCEMCRRKFC